MQFANSSVNLKFFPVAAGRHAISCTFAVLCSPKQISQFYEHEWPREGEPYKFQKHKINTLWLRK
jgi:hypothetical protein